MGSCACGGTQHHCRVVARSLLCRWCAFRGPSSGLYRFHVDASLVRWWWFLPGCFGFSLVIGMPLAAQKLGALATFVALIGAQMVGSMLGTALSKARRPRFRGCSAPRSRWRVSH